MDDPGAPWFAVTCSWCHAWNEISLDGDPWCAHCGHRADLPRAACDCPKCWKPDDDAARGDASPRGDELP
jgi:hypothetical protein